MPFNGCDTCVGARIVSYGEGACNNDVRVPGTQHFSRLEISAACAHQE
jgi:hypothetical protein